jgi:hypothetical protein
MNADIVLQFREWGRKRRERSLKSTNYSVHQYTPARRISYLWTAFPRSFSPTGCMSCKRHFTPDSFVALCPLFLHVKCGTCFHQNLDGKCPCFIEIEWILRRLIGNKDVAARIAFFALDYHQ